MKRVGGFRLYCSFYVKESILCISSSQFVWFPPHCICWWSWQTIQMIWVRTIPVWMRWTWWWLQSIGTHTWWDGAICSCRDRPGWWRCGRSMVMGHILLCWGKTHSSHASSIPSVLPSCSNWNAFASFICSGGLSDRSVVSYPVRWWFVLRLGSLFSSSAIRSFWWVGEGPGALSGWRVVFGIAFVRLRWTFRVFCFSSWRIPRCIRNLQGEGSYWFCGVFDFWRDFLQLLNVKFFCFSRRVHGFYSATMPRSGYWHWFLCSGVLFFWTCGAGAPSGRNLGFYPDDRFPFCMHSPSDVWGCWVWDWVWLLIPRDRRICIWTWTGGWRWSFGFISHGKIRFF